MTRSNILVVVFDSLSEQACRALGADLPVLTTLRGRSTVFGNAYAPSPESGPSRASLFTGLDMAAHGVWTDGVALPERETTVAQRLADCGWRTWLVGRRHLSGQSHWTTEHARPFEYAPLEWAHGPLHRSRQNAYLTWFQTTAPETYAGIFPSQPDPDNTASPGGQRAAVAALPDELSFNHWVGLRTCELVLRQPRAQPFLGIAGFVVGETMGAAPDPETCCERLDTGALRQADAALGKILRCLQDQGIAGETAVIVTAARGCVAGGDTPMREPAIKVPLMIRGPGTVACTVEPAVSCIDVAPTVYALAHVPPPLRVQGTSLLAAGSGDAARGWALSRLRSPDHGWMTALCQGRWKLVMTHGRAEGAIAPEFTLYDLLADPDETDDLAACEAHQGDLEHMLDLMIDARVALEDRTEPRIAKF